MVPNPGTAGSWAPASERRVELPRRLGAQHGVMARGHGSLADATGDAAAARGEKRGFGMPIRMGQLD